MATRHRIDNALTNIQTGDVEKYFNELSNIIETNSGTHDCKMISHDCNNTAVPVHGGQFTRFKLTDQAMDIVDMSKGYIMMKLEIDVNFDVQIPTNWTSTVDTVNYQPIYFIGFKSASHIVEIYNVYSNGVLTSCKQTKARHEQAITYNSKAKEERVGRPGMYTTHEKVREMSDCVCGAYIKAPKYAESYSYVFADIAGNTEAGAAVESTDYVTFENCVNHDGSQHIKLGIGNKVTINVAAGATLKVSMLYSSNSITLNGEAYTLDADSCLTYTATTNEKVVITGEAGKAYIQSITITKA